jgi:hypothetical protein
VIAHQYYPGFIDVPDDTDYVIASADIRGLVHVRSHVRPLVVTDFNNELTKRPRGRNAVQTNIKRPITKINPTAISVDASGHEGRKGPVIAVEKEVNGRTFRQDIYTSLEIRWEVTTLQETQNLSPLRPLLTRFIGTYRFLNPDPRLVFTDGVPDDSTPIRTGVHLYSAAEQALPGVQRLLRARAPDLRLDMLSYRIAGRALQDHAGAADALAKRQADLTGYLGSGFALSESLLEIERLANLAYTLGQPRAAIVEAMSILELGLLAQQRKLLPQLYSSGKLTKENEPTWKFLIDAILPALLDLYVGDKDAVMKQAHRALRLRHDVAHSGYVPSSADANLVLSFVRTVLSIFDLPDSYKSTWKMKNPHGSGE